MSSPSAPHREHSNVITRSTLARVRAALEKWRAVTEAHKVQRAPAQEHTREHIGDALRVCGRERMCSVDVVDGGKIRNGESLDSDVDAGRDGEKKDEEEEEEENEGDLIVVKPVIDGRLRDVGRS